MKIVLHKDRVLLKPVPLQTKDVLQDTRNQEDPFHFEVLQIGPDVESGIQIGDIVLKHQHTGLEFYYETEKRIIVREDDVHLSLRN